MNEDACQFRQEKGSMGEDRLAGYQPAAADAGPADGRAV